MIFYFVIFELLKIFVLISFCDLALWVASGAHIPV